MINDDLAMRSHDIHWPDGFSPEQADLFSHTEIFINAPRSEVWRHIVEAPKWPQWYPNSHDVRIVDDASKDDTGKDSDGVLRRDSRFDWNILDLDLQSTVWEYVDGSRIGWFGDASGLKAYHTWLLVTQRDGCYVTMEEVGNGPGAVTLAEANPDGMHRAHEFWLTQLRELSEKR